MGWDYYTFRRQPYSFIYSILKHMGAEGKASEAMSRFRENH